MAMTIDWDVVEGAGVRDTIRGVEIVRPIFVNGVPGDCSTGQNPSVLLNALNAPGMPTKYSPHPNTNYSNALLEDRNVMSVGSVDTVRVELIYRLKIIDPGGHAAKSAWTITDTTQTSHVTKYSTANGGDQAMVWYLAGTKKTVDVPPRTPNKAAIKIVGYPVIDVYRVIRASAILLATDWDNWKADVRAAKKHINSDTWGDAKRGTWLFLGPTTKYFEIEKKTVQVDLIFLENENGHFPILAYLNAQGVHPADCISEKDLRAAQTGINQLPLENRISTRNGLSILSAYPETAFSSLFAFDPSL